MGVRRVLSADTLNRVANLPSVRSGLLGEGRVDLSVAVANPVNVTLEAEGGGFFVHALSPGEYEVHSIFEPAAHGKTADAVRAGLIYMFTRTDCHRLLTKVPDGNDRAAGLARKAGFREAFRRDDYANGKGATFLSLTLEDWAMGCADLEAEGAWFHQRLEGAKRDAGSGLPAHPHDAAHERAVGATVLMLKAGNVAKGLAFYNRWAVFAGYRPIDMLTQSPVVLDVGDAVIELRGGNMDILTLKEAA